MGGEALFRQLAAESTAWERDGLVRRFSTHSGALFYGRVTKQEEKKTLPHSNEEGGLLGPLFPEKETEVACSDTTLARRRAGTQPEEKVPLSPVIPTLHIQGPGKGSADVTITTTAIAVTKSCLRRQQHSASGDTELGIPNIEENKSDLSRL